MYLQQKNISILWNYDMSLITILLTYPYQLD